MPDTPSFTWHEGLDDRHTLPPGASVRVSLDGYTEVEVMVRRLYGGIVGLQEDFFVLEIRSTGRFGRPLLIQPEASNSIRVLPGDLNIGRTLPWAKNRDS